MNDVRLWRGRTGRNVAARSAFTLIELMIVITIIVLLGGLVVYNLLGAKDEAKSGIAKAQMQQIERGLKEFRFKFDRYPNESEGLAVLWSRETLDPEADPNETKWKRFMEKPVPNDPWDQPWNYRPVSEHGDETTYDLWSNGLDKEEGTKDDVVSWDVNAADGGFGGSGELPPGP